MRAKTKGKPGWLYYESPTRSGLWRAVSSIRRGKIPKGARETKTIPHKRYSIWITEKYIHGPRIRQPDEFESLWIVPWKYARDTLKIKLDRETYPDGTMIIIGKLKRGGKLAQQSSLIPR